MPKARAAGKCPRKNWNLEALKRYLQHFNDVFLLKNQFRSTWDYFPNEMYFVFDLELKSRHGKHLVLPLVHSRTNYNAHFCWNRNCAQNGCMRKVQFNIACNTGRKVVFPGLHQTLFTQDAIKPESFQMGNFLKDFDNDAILWLKLMMIAKMFQLRTFKIYFAVLT